MYSIFFILLILKYYIRIKTLIYLKANNPALAIGQWKALINEFKTKSLELVKILTKAGRIKPTDATIIVSILENTDLDELTNPNVVGQ